MSTLEEVLVSSILVIAYQVEAASRAGRLAVH